MHRIWQVVDPRRTLIALSAFLFTLAITIHAFLLSTARYDWLGGAASASSAKLGVRPIAFAPDTPGTPVAVAAGAATTSTASPSAPLTVYFGNGAATLDSAAMRVVAAAARSVGNQPLARVAITGYTDAAGNLAANQELAKNRAKAVRDALVSFGAPADHIDMRPPAAVQANAAGAEQQARRVDLAITSTAAP